MGLDHFYWQLLGYNAFLVWVMDMILARALEFTKLNLKLDMATPS